MTTEILLPAVTGGDTAPTVAVTVVDPSDVADDVVALTLVSTDGSALPGWEPGAHVDLTLPDGTVRQYSLCGDPADTGRWRIAVLREQPSRGGSEWIHRHAGPGTVLRAGLPRNLFPLHPADEYVFVAGGVGITPILPMVERVAATGARWTLWYGGRSTTSMAFADELRVHGDRVRIVALDTAGPIPVAEAVGAPRAGTAVYCCGPAGLIDAVEQACRDFPAGSVHVERFVADVAAPTGDPGLDTELEVHLAQSGVTVTVGPEQTILDAVLEEGVEADFSCTQGFCGTCEVRVLDGVPDHRDTYLDPADPAGDTMMICVSRSRGPRLVLDL